MENIIIAEDNDDLLTLFKLLLSSPKFKVVGAENKHRLLNLIETLHPSLLIIDVHFGIEDGRLLCQELRATVKLMQTPIILMSASPEKLWDYKDFGADEILEKPFDIDMLTSKVLSLLPC